jgi:hypothetical protein
MPWGIKKLSLWASSRGAEQQLPVIPFPILFYIINGF